MGAEGGGGKGKPPSAVQKPSAREKPGPVSEGVHMGLLAAWPRGEDSICVGR